MDDARAAFAAEVVAAVRRRATGERFTAWQRALILRDLDAPGGVFDRYYGNRPGSTDSVFWKHVVGQCRAARAVAWGRAERMARRRLRGQPDVLVAIERRAA